METGETPVCPQFSLSVRTLAPQRAFSTKSLFFPTGVTSGGAFPPIFFAGALPRQSLFHPPLFTGLQIVRVTFHFSNDVFRLNLPFESTERILQGFALL